MAKRALKAVFLLGLILGMGSVVLADGGGPVPNCNPDVQLCGPR